MNIKHWILLGLVVVACSIIGQATTAPGPLQIAQTPLFARGALPPLNMLVMGKDHKIYYEAYNDASDLDGDGGLDIGYQGWRIRPDNGKFKIDYFGYFNSYACYTWDGTKFNPVGAAPNKTCTGQWSGDFLNYLTTSRMDALRRVLYGGWRQVDTASETVLQGAFFPQDGHSWGKEYQSTARDGYNIANYAPLPQPPQGRYHLFAVTTVTDNSAPMFRVLQNAPYRIWNWLSIEGPVAGNKCFTVGNTRVDCVNAGTSAPAYPTDRASFDIMENALAKPDYFFGSTPLAAINCNGASCNPNGIQQDGYLSIITGRVNVLNAGRYQFRVDGDDAIDFQLVVNNTTVMQAGCYGIRGFGAACNGVQETNVVNLQAGSYSFKFRHTEINGGDGYRLEARSCNGNSCNNAGPWTPVTSAGVDVSLDGASIATYDTVSSLGGASRADYSVRVSVCPDSPALRDPSCKAYPNGKFKPTGILHDYGESERMYFGLITGSQRNNLEGGILRRNVGNFKDEINATTGEFRTDVVGIARTIDRFRMIGGAYDNGTLNNLTSDSNWNWSGGYGNCPALGDRALANGECRMWGNPIAEMMYESLRYFAGASAATTRFATGGATAGGTEESVMGLPTTTWKDPYGSTAGGGLGFPVCARPYQTVISDINPSYDGDLPGSAFNKAVTAVNNTPDNIIGFSASAQGDVIWNHEFGGARNVFIGEVNGATNDAPTAKTASSFGNIRGLSPEEPTKGGTYYAASVARFGRITDISPAQSAQNLSTYAIALASPLPRIEFPLAGRTVTLMPFAKTVSGAFGGGTRKPTNTIIDFYVERMVNLPGQPSDSSVNGGRPYALFRINYEDVEQGNDHDMDAIARYEVVANADNTLNVNLTSEYAKGTANQNMGYVISGTNRDGVYLEVRDRDSEAATSLYILNTPPSAWAGDCLGGTTTAPCNQPLGFTASRRFSPAANGSATAIQLKDPLWYAAKYGGFAEASNGNKLPDGAEWDSNGDGMPDNYFLVTNPLNLRSQLTAAFDSIQQQEGNSGTLSISGARVGADSFVVLPSYNSAAGGRDWTGDLKAYSLTSNGQLGALRWSAASRLATAVAADRKIYTATSNVTAANRATAVKPFAASSLGASASEIFGKLGYTLTQVINIFGGSTTPQQMVDYLRGARDREGTTKDVTPFRKRTSILGDIINSPPVIATRRANYGWASATGLTAAQRESYAAYVTGKENKAEFTFVGANDGMLHAFDQNGAESFAYIPNGVLGDLGLLADPDYGHRYYVDGGLTLSDALVENSWKTILLGAAGAGGRTVFALDVTAPASFGASSVLWEVNSLTDPDVGYVMGKPLVVPIDSGRWVAIFGNGYNSANYNPVLFVVDIATGEVLRKIAPDDKTDESNGLGNVSALDSDNDGLVDTVYGGDLQGNVWKFDIGGATPASWNVALSGKPLFVAMDATGARQPITGSLELAVGPGAGYMIYFGTGRYFVSGDNSSSPGQQLQSLYGIWDNGTALASGRTSLVQQRITGNSGTDPQLRSVTRNPVSYFANRGWYLDLVVGTSGTGERFIAAPRLQSGKVFFPTYQPGVTSDCAPGGTNWLYALNPLSGGAAFGKITQPDVGDGDTGAVSRGGGAPNLGIGVTQAIPASNLFCDPTDPNCDKYCNPASGLCGGQETPSNIKCTETYFNPTNPDKPTVVQRACGRQSWRQLL